ncbi:MAG: AAA family ATPase, partial [Nanoarchaeota archaeon]
LNKWVGESSKGIRKIFEKARQASPCIIFFDEVDSIASRRGSETGTKVIDQMVNTLLAEIDGLQELNDVIVIAATNRPDIVDPALLRPGRFDRLLLIPPSNKQGRLDIFRIHTRNMPLAKDVNLDEFSKMTEGYVGSDIESVCREAGLLALRDDIKAKEVAKKHFEIAIKKVNPSVSPELMDKYKEVEENYLRNAKAGLTREVPNYFG